MFMDLCPLPRTRWAEVAWVIDSPLLIVVFGWTLVLVAQEGCHLVP